MANDPIIDGLSPGHLRQVEDLVLRLDGRAPDAVRAVRETYPSLAARPVSADIAAAIVLLTNELRLGSRLPVIAAEGIAPALRRAADRFDAALAERNT